VQKIESKLSIIEQELVDLKNKGKNTLLSRASMMQSITPTSAGGGGGLGMSQVAFAEKFDVIVEEVNQLWSFTQRYIDEQVIDSIQLLRSNEYTIREKMN
jgi:hypothetical protein